MLRDFTAKIWQEGNVYVAQCLELELSSYGDTEEEALDSLREAVELYYEDIPSLTKPLIRTFQVELDAA
jgi:predicted RNase H-like HicB family nuclease